MTEREYILASLQLEREGRMARWRVPGDDYRRVLPQQPQQTLSRTEAA